MSIVNSHDLLCPHCGHTQKTEVWASINVTLDAELKNKLLAGEINFFDCRKCGKKAFVNAPLLYLDTTKQFCVQYYPPNTLDDSDFLRRFNLDGSPVMPDIPGALTKKAAYLTKPHIVFDIDEMIRQVIFLDRIAAAATE